MPKFPEPPPPHQLATIPAATALWTTSTLVWRVYFQGGPFPSRWDELRTFGPTGSRFDHHLPPPSVQDRGILYAAKHGPTCIAEVFQDTRTIDRRSRTPWLVGFRLARDVTLLDLTGAWPTMAGASTAIHSGPRARARRWSQAIYAVYPHVEGILYCSSMDASRPALALFERARPALPRSPEFHRSLDDVLMRSVVDAAAQRFAYAVV